MLQIKFNKEHSVFWQGSRFRLFTLKVENKDLFVFSVFEEDRRASAYLTGDEFSSYICEMVKYCLDLPEIARAIPCPVTLLQVRHGCLQTMSSKIIRKGDDYIARIDWDARFLRYHGISGEAENWHWKKTDLGFGLAPNKSKALSNRSIIEFRIRGINRAVKIQNVKNPALKVTMTLKKHLLDCIDEALTSGLYLNRQEFIVSAIRHELELSRSKNKEGKL